MLGPKRGGGQRERGRAHVFFGLSEKCPLIHVFKDLFPVGVTVWGAYRTFRACRFVGELITGVGIWELIASSHFQDSISCLQQRCNSCSCNFLPCCPTIDSYFSETVSQNKHFCLQVTFGPFTLSQQKRNYFLSQMYLMYFCHLTHHLSTLR